MDKRKDSERLKDFIKKIEKGFSPCKILLFGSRARNEEWENSDYDIVIISDKFEGVHWLNRISSIVKYWNLYSNIDILPYTFEEFENKLKESSFVRNLAKESVELTLN